MKFVLKYRPEKLNCVKGRNNQSGEPFEKSSERLIDERETDDGD